jgi:hypothetical protein
MTVPRQGVHIASEPPRSTRRFDRRFDGDMRKGEALDFHYENGSPPFSLGGDRAAFAAMATLLIRHASVVPASGVLFDCMSE